MITITINSFKYHYKSGIVIAQYFHWGIQVKLARNQMLPDITGSPKPPPNRFVLGIVAMLGSDSEVEAIALSKLNCLLVNYSLELQLKYVPHF